MKYLAGKIDGEPAVFAVLGDEAVNLTAENQELGTDLMAMIGDYTQVTRLMGKLHNAPKVAVSAITPTLPIAAPETILCLGLNYAEHVAEGGYEIPDYPALFMRGRRSLMAAGQPMVVPAASEQLDYEAELMIVIGKPGRHIAEADALDHVFGYTTFNDGSVRAYQKKTHQWTPGKNFDSTGAVGPVVVTPDELPEGAKGLRIESRIGDEVLQSSNTDNMMWSVPRIIATISEFKTLMPGDLIATGTPPGVGQAKPGGPRWLKPGEMIEVEIEGIGVCANPVVAES
ncbi:MAG: fumarylacetoacetate hydrolase family protein [Pseudomonadota bacterium]